MSTFLDRREIDELPMEPIYEWPIRNHDLVRERYNRIAAFIPFFEYVLFMPSSLRERAVDQLKLRLGDRVLEVGCGTGRNFPFLRDAVGPEGRICGVDLSEGMLRRARKLCQRRQWTNFVLIETDAADYAGEELFDGALFSFSYNVMPHHNFVLRQVWKQLRPGGRLVIVDARLPPGLFGKLIRSFATLLMKQTLLGNPLIRPWQYHAALVDDFQMEHFRFNSYYICCGTKPERDLTNRTPILCPLVTQSGHERFRLRGAGELLPRTATPGNALRALYPATGFRPLGMLGAHGQFARKASTAKERKSSSVLAGCPSMY